MILISSLSIFPIKSCRGIAVRRARVVRRGLEHDHRWMVIDETGYMITQREAPKLATVITVIRRDALIVEAEGRLCVRVPLRPKDDGTRVNVYVHDEERRKPIAAMDMGET
ncbi:MOSC domain-containing protein, partial [bacterium]|nr:MOSC domain-containing protein [bacterium]